MIDASGPEKRRRRTTQEKLAIVQQAFESGIPVSPRCPAAWCGSQSVIFSGVSNTLREILLL